jgi:hypothetical protein
MSRPESSIASFFSPDRALVARLQFPTGLGQGRNVILKAPRHRHHRPFATHWKLVEYTQMHNLKLDLTTPPVRNRSI